MNWWLVALVVFLYLLVGYIIARSARGVLDIFEATVIVLVWPALLLICITVVVCLFFVTLIDKIFDVFAKRLEKMRKTNQFQSKKK